MQVKDQLNQLLLQQNFHNNYLLKNTCWYLVWLNRKNVIKENICMEFCQCLTHFTRLLLLNYVDGFTNIF